MDFGTWLYDEFVKWRGRTTNSVTDFAKWLDIPQAMVSRYIKHPEVIPDVSTIQKVAIKLPHVHAVMFGSSFSVALANVIKEALSECERQNINPSTEEGSRFISEFINERITRS